MSPDVECSTVTDSGTGSRPLPWLFSPTLDLIAFLGSAVVSLLLLGVGAMVGVLHSSSPEWTWITTVLLLDVAHVYSTAFRVYFDLDEFRRRRELFLLTPGISFAVGWAVYSEFGSTVFWRILSYLAVFHFVRQQYGWVALYRSRGGERDRLGQIVDSTTIYLATLYPLVWWHVNLPRGFG